MSQDSDIAEHYRNLREEMRERSNHNALALIDWCVVNEVGIKPFTPHHLRLTCGDKIIDVWPKKFRYHELNTDKRGMIVFHGDFFKFLFKYFTEPA